MRPDLRLLQPAIALAIVGSLLACAHSEKIQSSWPDPEITVDGAYADWSGRLVRLDDGRSVALGVANDRSNLYLCLVTRDFEIQSMIQRSGLTVWLDPDGGRRKRVGFRIAPIEPTAAATTPAYIEIVFDGAEYGEQLVGSVENGPVEVRSAAQADVTAYEIRLALGAPLGVANPRLSSVTLAPGSLLGVGVETQELRVGRGRDRRRDQPAPDAGAVEDSEEPGLIVRRTRRYEPLRAWVVATLAERNRTD
jgi:hypothetical protein